MQTDYILKGVINNFSICYGHGNLLRMMLPASTKQKIDPSARSKLKTGRTIESVRQDSGSVVLNDKDVLQNVYIEADE